MGSVLWVTVISRPDVAFAVSRLYRFNMNPSMEHHAAADRMIRYLAGTSTYGLQFGGSDSFETWSDASFGDNTINRKSSQTYIMKLFNGTIRWRASKQDTVTTSTTEAELLSLAQATKEALFTSRLITELGVQLDRRNLAIWCDNQQTIRLVNSELSTLKTKLRHVDIHNHWLREAASQGRISVEYTKTTDMLADGLTKALQGDKFVAFKRQLGLTDIRSELEARKLRELTTDDLDQMEDRLEGGESS